ncbi:nuclear speckle splicing regulatory protein 1 [Diachasma alloeum]|uniref:nuclear speckle splicing regulatory protein 1 n=1 Tax=Diachasma alloeum TaxID=454923 RepID=UPI0007384283|nr:nuclear speckle splicing regulatory protein 1 [Diachasma alloeum]
MSKSTKQYGLLMPKKAALSAPKAGNIFGDDNDSDTDDGADWVKKALKAEGEKHKIKKQTRLNMEKALNEDPTIYQYDEVYDQIEKVKEQNKPVKKEQKQPKYIHNLLKAAERRKIEQEHRMERMVQKEREAEGEKFADKESFVTSAYREKLEQFKKIEEEEERMDRLEAIADVTKQPDMSGFHRHLFAQTFDPKSNESPGEEHNSKEPRREPSPSQSPNIDRDENLSVDSSSEESDNEAEENDKRKAEEKSKMNFKGKNNRQYRKRVMEESESESEGEPAEKSEGDEDARMGGDDASDKLEENEKYESPTKKPRLSTKEADEEQNESVKPTNDAEDKAFSAPEPEKLNKEKSSKKTGSKEEKPEEKKPSIWEKRTVGPVFEAALQRYFARKALRLSGT